NRNQSRLSRMPGVERNGHKQFLVDTNIGKQNWNEWQEWIEGVNDDLPNPESLSDVWDNLPELAPCLIDNVLRKGHKMLIAGPSKAGKSFLLIELCIAIAEGLKWLNWQCAQGKILYVNLELDRASCLHRFKDVYRAMGVRPENLSNIDIWNLRGKSVPMDKLAPKLIRRAREKGYVAVVIDPIYKVITGDENSADQMAAFCNQFDKICTELGCAVIYCHHHSKGLQGGKNAIDRASGSGVFGRDPDALLDIIQLETTKELMDQEENKAVCKACEDFLTAHHLWPEDDEPSQDDRLSKAQMTDFCKRHLDKWQMDNLNRQIADAVKTADIKTAWQIDGTLREFPKFEPVNLWFDYPVHLLDDVGSLKDVKPESGKPLYERASERRKKNAEKKRDSKRSKYTMAIENYRFENDDQYPTVNELYEILKGDAEAVGEKVPALKTVRNSLPDLGYVIDKRTSRILPAEEKNW
ncbi:MAG: AAA family ATPase, partial [Clostridiales bacterium]|nr:AAA family ATPase [Clostridiales bacterium]